MRRRFSFFNIGIIHLIKELRTFVSTGGAAGARGGGAAVRGAAGERAGRRGWTAGAQQPRRLRRPRPHAQDPDAGGIFILYWCCFCIFLIEILKLLVLGLFVCTRCRLVQGPDPTFLCPCLNFKWNTPGLSLKRMSVLGTWCGCGLIVVPCTV